MPYTSSQANTGLGTVIAIQTGTTGGGTPMPIWTTVGELTDAPLSGRKVNTTDVTNFQSLAQEFKATLLTSGDVKLSGNYIGTDTGQIALETAFEGKATSNFQITLEKTGTQTVSGDVFTFAAIVEELNSFSSLSPSKAVQFAASLKISGAITKTAGS